MTLLNISVGNQISEAWGNKICFLLFMIPHIIYIFIICAYWSGPVPAPFGAKLQGLIKSQKLHTLKNTVLLLLLPPTPLLFHTGWCPALLGLAKHRPIVFIKNWYLLFIVFWPRWLCVRHPRWRLQCLAGHCYYHRSVFFFSPSFAFDPLWGKSRVWKFVSPNILA